MTALFSEINRLKSLLFCPNKLRFCQLLGMLPKLGARIFQTSSTGIILQMYSFINYIEFQFSIWFKLNRVVQTAS